MGREQLYSCGLDWYAYGDRAIAIELACIVWDGTDHRNTYRLCTGLVQDWEIPGIREGNSCTAVDWTGTEGYGKCSSKADGT